MLEKVLREGVAELIPAQRSARTTTSHDATTPREHMHVIFQVVP